MRILVTNDDGIKSDGIKFLTDALSKKNDVYVVAPDKNRSAVSHSFTLREALTVDGPVKKDGATWYSCSGTPSDCVHIVLAGLLGFMPDVVLSGINKGENLGTDIVFSGTVAAARHASMEDVPGIAVSLGSPRQTWNFAPLAGFICKNLDMLVSMCSKNVFLNVNAHDFDFYKGWKLTSPSERIYNDRMSFYKAPDGLTYAFKIFGKVESVHEDNGDADVVRDGYISVSKIHSQPQIVSDGDDR
ncbi:MAG: 5'/3'-nucleotidase SurE [Treponemataceae bacterium]|nr:5'/3'-nucleotidase SurE [Treponemataceae bacterium]